MSVDMKSSYYDEGGIETIEVVKAKLTPEQFEGYLLGNIIKYSCRINYKGSFDRDCEKVGIYSKMLLEFRASLVKIKRMDYGDIDHCTNCGASEVESNSPRTLYACNSSQYNDVDFKKSMACDIASKSGGFRPNE